MSQPLQRALTPNNNSANGGVLSTYNPNQVNNNNDNNNSLEDSTLTQIFNELRSKDEICRKKGARDLRKHFISASKVLSQESLTVHFNEINRKMFSLASSTNVYEQLGGVEAIKSMVELLLASSDASAVPGAEEFSLTQLNSSVAEGNNGMFFRYSSYLSKMIPANDLRVMKAAAEALALLATPNGSYTQDFVLAEVKKALEYLVDKNSSQTSYQI
ncbi:unnamed protein product [Ambrosiozyma monospora]|uniref:Unnamed protein product n=1 Tax=Ambrosiozyma monospora TaxID=43982 RepID=A0ACB5TC75_AMBMO|nr:unnamed protein product [Ambrosiozyma monospora]